MLNLIMSLHTKPQCWGLTGTVRDHTVVETRILGLEKAEEEEGGERRRGGGGGGEGGGMQSQ